MKDSGQESFPSPIMEESIENSDVYDLHTRLSSMDAKKSSKAAGCFGKCKKS